MFQIVCLKKNQLNYKAIPANNNRKSEKEIL